MEVQNPRRILVLGPPNCGSLQLLKDLTGSAPTPVDNSTAGLSHEWRLETRYYKATIPTWVDEVADIAEWRTEFMKDEAKEVVAVLGAFIYCFRRPLDSKDVESIKEALKAIQDVGAAGGAGSDWGYGGEVVRLAVAMPQSTTPYLEKDFEEWDEMCGEFGFEYVDFEAKGRNEYGEPVGIERIKEALSTNEWAAEADDDDVEEALAELGLDEDGDFNGSFAAEEVEINMEFMGMKEAIYGEDGEPSGTVDDDQAAQVEELERMMVRMQAVKGMSFRVKQSRHC
ncbi:hypothetical protein NA57DRAFT_70093 [Rhizodiscina lignyota]|uniref:Increased recombination centers protein 6 n=1 Tax=Rhizodiscina lignyota TaxID=1504668 RepID=A0A9P4IR72_9PEZI|nr:hypothetical protein NA57DRAFT_70093 [Rhizodiscina lignyota]